MSDQRRFCWGNDACECQRHQEAREERDRQQRAQAAVRALLQRAIDVARDLDWRWGSGEPLTNVRYALEELIAENAPPGPPPPYQKRKLSRSLIKRVMERDAYRCQHCQAYTDLTVDHIVPELLGGTDGEDNLRTLCRSCNSRKGVRV